MHTFNASLFVSTGYGLQHISFSHGQTVRSGRSHIYTAGTFDEPFRVGTYRVSVKNKDDIDVKKTSFYFSGNSRMSVHTRGLTQCHCVSV